MKEKDQVPIEEYEKADLISPNSDLLNKKSEEIRLEEVKSQEIQSIIDRMIFIARGERSLDSKYPTMVGLAAPQIGISKRIILIDTGADGANLSDDVHVVMNPNIQIIDNETELGREGCYSTDRICGAVERYKKVRLTGMDGKGEPISLELEGFPARIAQHEVDHLDGIRFPDRISNPNHLHWVPIEKFGNYRKDWKTWTELCSREKWESIKTDEGQAT